MGRSCQEVAVLHKTMLIEPPHTRTTFMVTPIHCMKRISFTLRSALELFIDETPNNSQNFDLAYNLAATLMTTQLPTIFGT